MPPRQASHCEELRERQAVPSEHCCDHCHREGHLANVIVEAKSFAVCCRVLAQVLRQPDVKVA
jgi:hypothetical protein